MKPKARNHGNTALTLWLPQLPPNISSESPASLQAWNEPTLTAYWLFADDTETTVGSLGELQEAIGRHSENTAQPISCTLIIPGERVTSLRISAPNKRALQAIPYLVEEQLAAPLETLHISSHSTTSATELLTQCIDRQLLEQLLQLTKDIGLQCEAVIPDYALLGDSEHIQCCKLDRRLLCKMPDGEGFCLSSLQQGQLQEQQEQQEQQDSQQRFIEQLSTEKDLALQFVDPDTLALMRSATKASRHYTVLTGPFQHQHNDVRTQSLKAFGIAIAASLSVLISYAVIAGWQFNSQADHYYAQAEQHYRDLFPETRRITNLRRQLQGKLNSAQGISQAAGFLPLLNDAVPALTNTNQYRIRQIRYNQSQSTLQIELTSRDMNLLNQLLQTLQQHNLDPVIRSANNSEAGVLARLDIGLTN